LSGKKAGDCAGFAGEIKQGLAARHRRCGGVMLLR
jgi:hypothetical protein